MLTNSVLLLLVVQLCGAFNLNAVADRLGGPFNGLGVALQYVYHKIAINDYEKSFPSEYSRMPPIVEFHDYEECIQKPNHMYCFAQFTLVSDAPNSLLDMIHAYSDSNTRYNHADLKRGICVSEYCKEFYNASDVDQKESLEACLNETFWRTYNLKTKISKDVNCNLHLKPVDRNIADTIVALICALIIISNVIGSLYDYHIPKTEKNKALRLLLSFSVTRNWKKLVSPESNVNPQMKRLQCLYGFRVMSTLMVVLIHSGIPAFVMAQNKQFIEEYLDSPLSKAFVNKPLSMQIFLMISGFLMVYLGLLRAEKQTITWETALRMIRIRLLRLTPAYALMIGLTATWMRRASPAPYWQDIAGVETDDCRRYWWTHLLYINNFFDQSECMQHTWYIATDTQLYCLGAVLFVLCRSVQKRRLILPLLAVVVTTLVAVQTYVQDLDAVTIISPKSLMNKLMDNQTFIEMYKKPLSYIAGYLAALCFACLMYHWQKRGIQDDKLNKYGPLMWAVICGIMALSYSTSLFYEDRPRDPMYIRVLYSSLAKPVFATLLTAFMVGTMLRINKLSSRFLEWPWWRNLSQLSLSVYLVHVPYVRLTLAATTKTYHYDSLIMFSSVTKTLVVSYLLSIVYWLLVEAPASNLVDEFMRKPPLDVGKVEEKNVAAKEVKQG